MTPIKRFFQHLFVIVSITAITVTSISSFAATADIKIDLYDGLIQSASLEGLHANWNAFPPELNSPPDLAIHYNNNNPNLPAEVTFNSFAKNHIKLLTNNSKDDFVSIPVPQNVALKDAQSLYLLIDSYNTFEVGYGPQGGARDRTIGEIKLILDDGQVIDSSRLPQLKLVVGQNISDIWQGTAGNYRVFSNPGSSLVWHDSANYLNMLKIDLSPLRSINKKLGAIYIEAENVFQLLTPLGQYPPVSAYGGIRLMGISLVSYFGCDPNLARSIVDAPYYSGGKGYDHNRAEWVDAEDIKSGSYVQYIGNTLTTITGIDCSGSVMWSCNKPYGSGHGFTSDQNPVQYPGADGQFESNSESISEQDLLPGDVLFFDWTHDGFKDHVMMYVGGDDVVHASSSQNRLVRASLQAWKNDQGFEGFRRITNAVINFNVEANSPISLIVTDPDGFTITPDTQIVTHEEILREIPKILYYSTVAIDPDGHSRDMVYSPTLKTGNYRIKVVPKPGTLPTDTYGLKVSAAGTQIILAEDVPISSIPPQGYGIQSTGSAIGTISMVLGDVNVDGKVDCSDIAIIKGSFGKKTGQPGFDARADANNSGTVDVRDLAIVSRQLPTGTHCP